MTATLPPDATDPVERDVRATLEQAGGFDVPEPSPLFWEHQAKRISAAIAAELPPRRRSWAPAAWAGTAAAALVVAALILDPPQSPSRKAPSLPAVASAGAPVAIDVGSGEQAWTIVEDLSGQMDADQAAAVLMPAAGAADGAVLDLDPAERAELANLLRAALKAPRS